MSKYLKFAPAVILFILWVTNFTCSPIEDFEYTYVDGFIDALLGDEDEIGFFRRIIGGLPVAILSSLTVLYVLNRKGNPSIGDGLVHLTAMIGLITSTVYAIIILLMDGLYSSLMHYSREKARTEWNTDVDASVVDEIALIFYWFNIVVPVLYFLFIQTYRKIMK